MSGHVTEALVKDVARRAVEDHPLQPIPWDALDPLTQHGLLSQAAAFLHRAIPVLTEHGWTPPKETTHG